eukprot:2654453-Rhodomonas_salina.1
MEAPRSAHTALDPCAEGPHTCQTTLAGDCVSACLWLRSLSARPLSRGAPLRLISQCERVRLEAGGATAAACSRGAVESFKPRLQATPCNTGEQEARREGGQEPQ